jgi:hypothetical protein
MAETCYSKGKKIVLLPEQKRNGTWICRFTIPGLLDAGPRSSHDASLDAYATEWEAKAAAFEAAKRRLDAPPEMRPANSPGRAR